MTEIYEHNPDPKDHDDPVSGPTWLVGLIGAILLAVTMLGLTAFYYNVQATEFETQFVGTERLDVIELRQQQEALLTGPPRWVDRQEQDQTVRAFVIPIEQAMALVVEEEGR